jgi:dTDP-4-amino-4,6-dideoxygalactose transaminase
MPGFNYRMTDFQAALGLTQMTKLDRIISARRRLAAHYDELLERGSVRAPTIQPGSHPVYQSYVASLPVKAGVIRSKLITRLGKLGIECSIGTYNLPMTTYFRTRYRYTSTDFPISSQAFERSIALPMYETMSTSEQKEVVDSLRCNLDLERGISNE